MLRRLLTPSTPVLSLVSLSCCLSRTHHTNTLPAPRLSTTRRPAVVWAVCRAFWVHGRDDNERVLMRQPSKAQLKYKPLRELGLDSMQPKRSRSWGLCTVEWVWFVLCEGDCGVLPNADLVCPYS